MIIVTGANGPLGRLVVEHLVPLVPAGDVVASVRDPAAFGLDVEVRRGDFDDPATLDFAGADTVFLNATNYGSSPAVRGRQQANAIAAARAAGVRRVVLTSWQDADTCPLESMTDYPATERLVATSVEAWTVVRLGYGLAAALARDVLTARKAGVMTAPAGDARVAAAATADLAEAVARVLAGTGAAGHDGKTYNLTGPDAVGWAELAALAGPGIAYRPVTDDDFGAQAVASGFPAGAVGQLLALYAAFRSGWANTPTTDLARLLGRPPTRTLDAVAAAVESWTWS
jgi:NAD(P)H dehydrogenase (quinone)